MTTALAVTVVLAFGLVLMPMLRRRSAALRHWILAVALFVAALTPVIGLVSPSWPRVWPAAALGNPVEFLEARLALSPPLVMRPALGLGPSDASTPQAASTRAPLGVLRLLWIAGTASSLIALLAGLRRLVRLTRSAQPVTQGAWIEAVSQSRHARRLDTPVAIVQSAGTSLVLIWGVRRATLVIPTAALTWSANRVAPVVDHELAHVARHDWLVQLGAELVKALYWWHPLVWVGCARLRRECEHACDDEVLTRGVEPTRYAAHLIAIARELGPAARAMPAPAVVRTSTLERRITAMLSHTVDRRTPSRRARSLSLAALLASALFATGLAAAQTFSSLTGTIVDPSNALLPGVTLALTNRDTQAKYEIRTGPDGRYEFVGLPPGTYVLESRLPGFSRFSGQVTVTGKAVQQDLTLEVGRLQETINVTAGPSAQPPTAPSADERERIDALRRKLADRKCPADPPTGTPRIGGNLRPPYKLVDVKPRFPESLTGTDGDVVLNANIGADGRVDRIDVASSSHAEFSDAAMTAVRGWEFSSVLLNCQPVDAAMQVTVTFRNR